MWFSKLFNFKKDPVISLLPDVRGTYQTNVPMSRHTWFGVGGPAEVMFVPEDEDDLAAFFAAKPYNLPTCVIGGGSNLLVRDGGIPGVVIKLASKYFKQIKVEEGKITCYSGVRNTDLRKVFLDNQIGGLEFLCSIPGHIGGSIKTNAGCFGTEVKDVILSATIVDGVGAKKTVTLDDLKLSYRSSFFPDDWIITSITFKTKKAKKDDILKIMDEQKEYRIKNQPYNEKTAGSTFKNPEGLKAWQLIKNSGCAELSINGAKVSEKHCNFLINSGNATAHDIETLGETIIQKVKEHTSITLEWEVKRMGIHK